MQALHLIEIIERASGPIHGTPREQFQRGMPVNHGSAYGPQYAFCSDILR